MGICAGGEKKKQGNPTYNQQNIFQNEKIVASQPLFPIRQKEKLKQTLHRSIIAMKGSMKNTNKTVYGSGVLISKNIILTAAHNIYDTRYRRQQEKQRYKVYLENDGMKFYQIQDWRYPTQFGNPANTDQTQYDYALIRLKNSNLPTSKQFLQISLPCKCILDKNPQLLLKIYGYPFFDKNYQPLDERGLTIKLCQFGLARQNSIIDISPLYRIKYSISTLQGQSGCPVVCDNKIIGVHKGAMKNQQCNVARLVTKDMVNNLNKWNKELQGDSFKINETCPHIKQNHQDPKITEKKQSLQKSMKIMKPLGEITMEAAENVQIIGVSYEKDGNYEMALQNYQKSLNMIERIKGKKSIEAALIIHKIGSVYTKQANYQKALDNYIESKQIFEKIKGKGCFESAKAIQHIGSIYDDQGKLALAMENYNTALQIYEKTRGKGCIQSAKSLHNIGSIYYCQNNYVQALKYFGLSLEIVERVKGEGDIDSVDTLHAIGNAYYNQKQYSYAINYYDQSKRIYESWNITSKDYSSVLFNMGKTYYDLRNYEEAVKVYELSIRIDQANKEETQIKHTALNLAKCLKALNKTIKLHQIINQFGLNEDDI